MVILQDGKKKRKKKKSFGMDGKVCTPVSHPGEGGDIHAPVLCHCSVSKHSFDGAEWTDQRHLCTGREDDKDIHVDLQGNQEVTHLWWLIWKCECFSFFFKLFGWVPLIGVIYPCTVHWALGGPHIWPPYMYLRYSLTTQTATGQCALTDMLDSL